MIEYSMLIAGEPVSARGDRRLPVVNPFDGDRFGTVPDGTREDVDDAVRAARSAFDSTWSSTPGVRRAELLHRLAAIIAARADELGTWETRDNGKLLAETRAQARFAARSYAFFAGYADKLYGRVIPLDTPETFDYTLRQPLGVVALITAWNSPMQLLANKLAPALAAGNTVVIKPSEHASVTTVLMAEMVAEAGFPPGVVNIVTGGAECGRALTEHPGLDGISFTGSLPTGQAIAHAAARTMVPVTLELGGKSANIIFDDADLDVALRGAIVGIFSAGGQTCIAGSRLLVHRPLYDHVVTELGARADRIRLGDPLLASTHMGPVANEPQWDRVTTMVQAGVESGARLVAGGGTRDAAFPESGLFVRPTVFADVDNASPLARQEIFGPVLSIIPFESEEEAVTLANDSDFGLAAGLWTRDLSRAHRVAEQIVAGTVWVNTYRVSAAQAPFGGVRMSGQGRERGAEALDGFLRTKNVLLNLSGSIADPFDDLVEVDG
ncbi:aldehyde dehydrogenase [Pseudonocardia pini]|uniref:aldehyde dehydrogenase n=1 Tax=Pseudonocardia pini TaxID=2758030 RepID=UPI0015F0B1FB|nr:aldehyde dehydrogenase [Pseudonocardia pini]